MGVDIGWSRFSGRRLLSELPESQRPEVEALLEQRLPLIRVYKRMARNAKIEDFPIDLALAESLRLVAIPGTGVEFFETHTTNLLYAAGGESTQESHLQYPNRPVRWVSAHDAEAYAEKWNRATRQLGLKGKAGLPSAELDEQATRGGTTTEYISGDEATRLSRYAVYEQSEITDVASKRSLRDGIKDPVGLLWRWTSTPWGWGSWGSNRVVRGGGWSFDAPYLRSAYRGGSGPGYRYSDVGLRLVRTVP